MNRNRARPAQSPSPRDFYRGSGGLVYRDWHWGLPHSNLIDWTDPDYPEGELIECGRLKEIHVRRAGTKSNRVSIMKMTSSEEKASHLVFDPNHRWRRLYMLCSADLRTRMKPLYSVDNGISQRNMNEVARALKGRHATEDYPPIKVRPLGVITHVVYSTEKKGDGPSAYIHELGEVSGIRPWLCVDARGRLWMVGGNYTVPNPGITD